MTGNKAHRAGTLQPTPRMARTAALLVEGIPAGEAMREAGYSNKYARNPHQLMRRAQMVVALRRLAPDMTQELIEGTTVRAMTGKDVGQALTGATLAARLRGLLIERREQVNVSLDASAVSAMRAELAALYADSPPCPADAGELRSQADRAADAPSVDTVKQDSPDDT